MKTRRETKTKRGPGRRHVQGPGRKRTALKYPGTHREHFEGDAPVRVRGTGTGRDFVQHINRERSIHRQMVKTLGRRQALKVRKTMRREQRLARGAVTPIDVQSR